MKCYEVTKCSNKEREACYVWNSFRDRPDDLENLECWVVKGCYHEENGAQAQKCKKCKYYLLINHESGIASEADADLAMVACSGTINLAKTRALDKVWETLKKNRKYKVLIDISRVTAVYSCGLSLFVKMHREVEAAGGMLMIAGGGDNLNRLFQTGKLTKILHFAQDKSAALQLFATAERKRVDVERLATETARKAAEETRKAAEPPKPKPANAPKQYVRCWEYWNNQNPANATTCDECFHKKNPKSQACWVVEGIVEGVTFHFINEACVNCRYFEEYAVVPQRQSQT